MVWSCRPASSEWNTEWNALHCPPCTGGGRRQQLQQTPAQTVFEQITIIDAANQTTRKATGLNHLYYHLPTPRRLVLPFSPLSCDLFQPNEGPGPGLAVGFAALKLKLDWTWPDSLSSSHPARPIPIPPRTRHTTARPTRHAEGRRQQGHTLRVTTDTGGIRTRECALVGSRTLRVCVADRHGGRARSSS